MPHTLRATAATAISVFSVIFSMANAPAQATATFAGNSSGTFGTPTVDLTLDQDATFSVESPASGSIRFVSGRPGDGSMPNQLTFTSAAFTALQSSPFAVAGLSFLNGQTFTGTNISSIPLTIGLSLDSVPQSSYLFQYQFNFDLTVNGTENDNSAADIVTIEDLTQVQSFGFEQTAYELTLLGFSPDRGETFARSLSVFEDQTVHTTLFAQIKLAAINAANDPPTSVPEPIVLSGLLALSSTLLLRRTAH